MKRFPLLFCAIAFGAGIFASIFIADRTTGIVLTTVGIFIGIAYLSAPRKHRILWSDYGLFPIMWALICLGTGLTTGSYRIAKPLDTNNDIFGPTICAKVKSVIAKTNGDGITAEITGFKDLHGNLTLYNAGTLFLHASGDLDPSPGDLIEFEGELHPYSDIDNTLPQQRNLKLAEIMYRSSAHTPYIRITGHSSSIMTCAQAIRDKLVIKLEKSSLTKEAKELCASLLLGDRSMLTPATRDTFRNSGLSHIIAISGLHIAIIAGILMIILMPMRNLKMRKLRYIMIIAGVWTVAVFTGLSPSACRAAVMASFILLAAIAERKNTSLNALGAAAILILIIDPYSLFNVGFQLSFICVAAIIVFASKLNFIDRRRFPLTNKIFESIIVTLVAVGSTWALTCYYFGTFPIAFLPANFIVVPMLAPIIASAMGYIALLAAGIDFIPLGSALSRLLELLPDIATKFNTTIEVAIPLITPVFWILAVSMAIAAFHVKKKKLLLISSSIAASIAIFSAIFYKPAAYDGVIISPGNKSSEIALINHGERSMSQFQRHSVTSINTPCGILTFVDMPEIDKNVKCDIIIITSRFKGDLLELKKLSDATCLVIHSSVQTQAALELRAEAEAYGFETHDLRQDGQFRKFIQQ